MPADDITISLELPGCKVTQQTREPDGYRFWVDPTAYGAVCPRCGRASADYHDGYERTVRDFPILCRPVSLHVWQRRFKCTACGKPFNEPLPAIDWEQRQTRRYQHFLVEQCRTSAFQEVSRKHQIGYRIVERLYYRQAHYQFDEKPRRLPKRLGLDEFAKRKGHNYATVLVNLRTHHVFEVLDQRTKATVRDFLANRMDRRRLQVVTIDMRREFRDAVQEQCPWALIVVDRFHVMQQATAALHAVRKRLTHQAPAADQARLKESRKLLGHAAERLVPAQRQQLYTLLVNCPELRCAHTLVHWLRRWYALTDVHVARARLRAWLYRVKHANLVELNDLAAIIRRWQPWILHFFCDRVTNGVTEGINTKIKLLKRIAYGLPNFAHIRARILMEFASEMAFPP
jgi:transposase